MLLTILMSAGGAAFAAFAAVFQDLIVVPASAKLWVMGTAAIVGGLAVNGAIPLFFELCVETAHPVPEGTTVTVVTTMCNIGSLIFLSIPVHVGNQSTPNWMSWAMCGMCAAAAVAVSMVNVQFRRYEHDMADGVEGVPGDVSAPLLGLNQDRPGVTMDE